MRGKNFVQVIKKDRILGWLGGFVHFLQQFFRLFFQHEREHFLRHRIIPDRRERLAMQGRRPMLA